MIGLFANSARGVRASLSALCLALPVPALAEPNLNNLISILDSTPEGSWVKVNNNLFPDVWTPASLRPLMSSANPEPSAIIGAWSSFAWDQNRGDLIIFGGGHANYTGNDIYRWRGTTQLWERASLPSEIKMDDKGNWIAVDGPLNAPAAAHTYDNNIFLPIVDRMLTFGGAAYNNGAAWETATSSTTERRTGPYLWDPNKADGNKVGGTTGSHVKRVSPYPEVVGGHMWTNRDLYGVPTLTGLPVYHVHGCTAYASEGGKDVVYVGNNTFGGTELNLHRYVLNDINNPAADTWQMVGAWAQSSDDQTACGYDPVRKIFLRTGSDTYPFVYWDLTRAGPTNYSVRFRPTDPTGEFSSLLDAGDSFIRMCGMDFDNSLGKFSIWCGDGRVWHLTPPASLSSTGWIIQKQPTPVGSVPAANTTTGILGKWKYIPNLNTMMALAKASEGNIWLYRPVGWVRPVTPNLLPEVSITSPASPASATVGGSIQLAADATDPDGSIARVDFFDGTTLIGQDTSAPYAITWTGATAGVKTITAVATDNRDGQRTSAPLTLTVNAASSSVTLTLQDGLNNYVGTRDAYLSNWHPDKKNGFATLFLDQDLTYTVLVKFAVFQSEGGPVPNGATITNAKFSIYKSSVYDLTYNLHRVLLPWSEDTVTWRNRSTGLAWAAGGISLADVDYRSTPDATTTVTWNPGWATFDVTSAVQSMQSSGVNNGWRLRRQGSYGSANQKNFLSREYLTDPLRRPKLEITYTSN